VASGVRNDMPKLWPILEEQFRKVKAIDMESYGFYSAVFNSRSKCKFLMVKAVQNFADGENDNSFLEYCCELSSAWIVEFVDRHAVDGWLIP